MHERRGSRDTVLPMAIAALAASRGSAQASLQASASTGVLIGTSRELVLDGT